MTHCDFQNKYLTIWYSNTGSTIGVSLGDGTFHLSFNDKHEGFIQETYFKVIINISQDKEYI